MADDLLTPAESTDYDASSIEVLETRSFPTESGEDGAAGEIETWLEEAGNPRIYLLLPAGMTISRVLDLGDEGQEEDLDLALRLQAESHLLGGIAAHRICMAPLPVRAAGKHQGLVITWPDSSKMDLPPLNEDPLCLTETTALLGLLGRTALSGPLLHAERNTGSLSVILEQDGELAIRSMREYDDDHEQWTKAIVQAVVETAITSNHSNDDAMELKSRVTATLEDRDEALLVPDEVHEQLGRQVTGAEENDAWWQEWGLNVGALLACSGTLQPLTNLMPRKPEETGGPFGEITRALARPMTAAAILAGAFIAVALIPLIASWIQLKIIENKIDDQVKLEQILQTNEQQQAVYDEIAKRSWPMTKLLGDVANCIPLGITADQITVNEGDAVIIRGSAGSFGNMQAKSLLHEMQNRLEEAGIFGAWDLSEEAINSAGKIDFSITLPVNRPFKYIRKYQEDFADKTHGERRYPEIYAKLAALEAGEAGDATATGESSSSTRSDETADSAPDAAGTMVAQASSNTAPTTRSSSGSSSRTTEDPEEESSIPMGAGRESLTGVRGGVTSRGNSASSSSSSRRGSIRGATGQAVRRSDSSGAASSGSGPAPIPDEFTDAELAALSRPEANELLSRVAKAKQRSDLDDVTKQRLKDDVYRILDHMKTIPNTGGS